MSDGGLAPYAAHDTHSRGRRYAEPPPEYRSEFQRDRDRIIHCNAFRRRAYKTQVFVNHEGDLYRTRVTHSIEVAQIARSVARALSLNETLTEAISLAHDLGHTPFGHAGQDALNDCPTLAAHAARSPRPLGLRRCQRRSRSEIRPRPERPPARIRRPRRGAERLPIRAAGQRGWRRLRLGSHGAAAKRHAQRGGHGLFALRQRRAGVPAGLVPTAV